MLEKFHGLPAHVLLIHVVIAAVPLAALLVVLHAVWPAARRRLGIVTPIVALVALVIVPITTSAGHWFKNYIFNNDNPNADWKARITKHANLAGNYLWYVIALFVVAAALWYLGRSYEYGLLPDKQTPNGGSAETGSNGSGATRTAVQTQRRASVRTALPTWASAVIAVVALAVAIISVVQLYRIGDAGAQAVWHGTIH